MHAHEATAGSGVVLELIDTGGWHGRKHCAAHIFGSVLLDETEATWSGIADRAADCRAARRVDLACRASWAAERVSSSCRCPRRQGGVNSHEPEGTEDAEDGRGAKQRTAMATSRQMKRGGIAGIGSAMICRQSAVISASLPLLSHRSAVGAACFELFLLSLPPFSPISFLPDSLTLASAGAHVVRSAAWQRMHSRGAQRRKWAHPRAHRRQRSDPGAGCRRGRLERVGYHCTVATSGPQGSQARSTTARSTW